MTARDENIEFLPIISGRARSSPGESCYFDKSKNLIFVLSVKDYLSLPQFVTTSALYPAFHDNRTETIRDIMKRPVHSHSMDRTIFNGDSARVNGPNFNLIFRRAPATQRQLRPTSWTS
jgi:hypothetical protein